MDDMTDWTTARVTPEMQAELRRLLDATETPWAVWDGYGPDGNGDMRVARIGHLSGSGIRADPDSADIYGRREAFELLASAVNALPALLDAAAERDALAAKLDAAIDVAHLDRQQAWSAETFGPAEVRGHRGVLDHILKELVEIEAEPGDVTEWADLIILAFDGAWRSGHSPADTIAAIKAKQERNEARTWPDWRTADPNKAIEHIRALDGGAES